jgi:deazaflavin-dependent oxidoreductase (nitroreductase family)
MSQTHTETRAPSRSAFDAGRPRHSLPVRWLARAVEPVARHMAGNRWFPLWAVLRHTGRTSGKAYATPVVGQRTPDGFLIPLPFGDATQWARNLFAADGGAIRFAGREYQISEPRIVDHDVAKLYLPGIFALVSAWLGLRQYVLVKSASG